ncbi:MAG: RidA family protein [Rhodoferax sp.]|nr:RidA family protein [Rhodoferax sp.]
MTTHLTFENPHALGPARGYSHLALVSGKSLVFISGQVGSTPEAPDAPPGDFGAQTDRVFANLQTAAGAVGTSFADIAKLNIYIVNTVKRTELAPLLAAITRHAGSGPSPASTLVFVSGLIHPQWLIEVEAIAVMA